MNKLRYIFHLDPRRKRGLLLSFGFLFLVLYTGFWIMYFIKPGKTLAAWFDDSYGYRVKFNFTHNADITSERSVTYTLDTAELIAANLMQADCDDTRFTDANGKPLLYDLTGTCNNAATTYEVIFPSIVNGSNLAYVYYANPAAVNAEINSAGYTALTPSGGDPSDANPTAGDEQGPSPISYWNFDEGYGSTANDYSTGSNNDLTITNAAWKTEDMCVSGKCLGFDGNADYATKTYSSDTELLPGIASFTVSGWFKHTSTTGADTLISRVDAVNGVGWKLYMNSSGYMCFGIDDTAGTFPADSACGSTSLADSQWHYITAVKSGTSTITLFIDGRQITQTAVTATLTLNGTNAPFTVGNDFDNGINGWDGFIDEVKYYNFAKSADQIKTESASRGTAKGVSASFGPDTNKSLSSGLVGYWKLDESSGNPADSSGNALTLTNNGTTTFTVGKFANASNHNGTTQYFNTATTVSGVQTVAFWVKPASTTDNYLNLIANTAYVNSSSGTVTGTGFTSPSVYINGVLNGSVTASVWNHVVVTSTAGINANAFEVGRANGSYLTNTGKLDEVRVYNRALSSAEVSALYNWAPGPIGYWKIDENTGTTAFDIGGNAYNGALTNNPKWSTGKYGAAINTNNSIGTSNIIVSDPTDGGLDFNATDNFTLMAWVKTTVTDSNTFIYKGFGGSVPGYRARTSSSGDAVCGIADNAAGTKETTATGLAISDGLWHHVACVMNADTLYIYVDGILRNSVGEGTETGSFESTTDFEISMSSSTTFWPGDIDEVKVYRYARTAKQIVEDMNAGHPAPGSPVGSYVARWKMDDMSGTTAQDTSDNNNDLTLSSASWTSSGKFDGAWNGTNAIWLSRADDADFDFTATENFAVSLWVKSDSATNPAAAEYLINKASATAAGYAVYANTSGQICFAIDDDTAWTPDVSACSTDDFYDNAWHHVVGIRNATADNLQLYVDGIQRTTASDTTTATLANALSLFVGDRDGVDNGDEFAGDLDEVKVFRFAPSPSEVLVDMNLGSASTIGGVADHDEEGFNITDSNLVGWWKLDENTGSTANDASGNGNTGTFGGGPEPVWTPGKIGPGVRFDGLDASNQRINAASGSSLDDLPAITASAWIYPVSQGEFNRGRIVNKASGNEGADGWYFAFDGTSGSNALRFFVDYDTTDLTLETVNNSVTLNTWNHVAVTWDGGTAASGVKFYVNGVAVSTTSSSNGSTSRNTDNLQSLRIGNEATSSRGFEGTLDDVRIYNSVLTPAQIAYDYNRGAPVAHYKFDECQGSTAYNAAVNANGAAAGMNGTITPGSLGNTAVGDCTTSGSTMWYNGRTGKYNSSLDFDGTDDRVLVSSFTTLPTTDFTYSAWVYHDAASGNDTIIEAINSGGTGDEFMMDIDGLDNFDIRVDGTTNFTATTKVATGGWHHVAVTRSSSTITAYVDGAASGTATDGDVLVYDGCLYIGADNDTTCASPTVNDYFDGKIDDVKVYNYALTATQIKRLYNEGSGVRFGPQTGSP